MLIAPRLLESASTAPNHGAITIVLFYSFAPHQSSHKWVFHQSLSFELACCPWLWWGATWTKNQLMRQGKISAICIIIGSRYKGQKKWLMNKPNISQLMARHSLYFSLGNIKVYCAISKLQTNIDDLGPVGTLVALYIQRDVCTKAWHEKKQDSVTSLFAHVWSQCS